jgi:hypothetical protein
MKITEHKGKFNPTALSSKRLSPAWIFYSKVGGIRCKQESFERAR